MTNQSDIPHPLNPHYANKHARLIPTKEIHPRGNLRHQISASHIRFMPAVRRDHASVSLRRLVNNLLNRSEIAIGATPDHSASFRSVSVGADGAVLHPESTRLTRSSANFAV